MGLYAAVKTFEVGLEVRRYFQHFPIIRMIAYDGFNGAFLVLVGIFV